MLMDVDGAWYLIIVCKFPFSRTQLKKASVTMVFSSSHFSSDLTRIDTGKGVSKSQFLDFIGDEESTSNSDHNLALCRWMPLVGLVGGRRA